MDAATARVRRIGARCYGMRPVHRTAAGPAEDRRWYDDRPDGPFEKDL
jgi:hypothetical protein